MLSHLTDRNAFSVSCILRQMCDLDPCSKANDGNQDNANCNKADSPGKETNSQLLSSPWYLHASFFLPSCDAASHAYYPISAPARAYCMLSSLAGPT